MNRTVLAGMALAALGMAGSAQAQAQQQPQQQPEDIRTQMQQQVGQLRAVTITVQDVNPQTHTVTFQAHVKPEANFRSGQGTPIRIDDLKPGDQVRAAFDPKTGEVVAVQVLPAGGAKGGTGGPSGTGAGGPSGAGGAYGGTPTPSR